MQKAISTPLPDTRVQHLFAVGFSLVTAALTLDAMVENYLPLPIKLACAILFAGGSAFMAIYTLATWRQ